MTVIKAPKTDYKGDEVAQQSEDHRREHGQQFQGVDDIRGNVFDLEFDPSLTPPLPLSQLVRHELGRVPSGWVLQGIQPKAGVAQIVEVSGTDDDHLALFATAACTARIKVF